MKNINIRHFKYFLFITIWIIILSFFSCHRNPNNVIYSIKLSDNYYIKVQEVFIPVDSFRLNAYKPFSVYESKVDTFFVGFNNHLYTLDFFSLMQNKFLYSVSLMNDGPDAVNNIEEFLILNQDSILIISEHELCIINHNGKKIWSRGINLSTYGDVFDTLRIYADSKFKPIIDTAHNILFLEVYDFLHPFESNKHYTGKIEAKYNLSDGSLTLLNIEYPEEYQQKDKGYGYLNFPSRIMVGDSSLFIFPVLPRLEVLLPNGHQRKYLLKSKFQKNDAKYLNRRETDPIRIMSHMIQSPIYDNLIYDHYRNLIYCFFLGPIPYKINDKSFNSFGDKPLSILILDKNLRFLSELALPGRTYTNQVAFVTSRGLYILKGHYKYPGLSADTLKFDVYSILQK